MDLGVDLHAGDEAQALALALALEVIPIEMDERAVGGFLKRLGGVAGAWARRGEIGAGLIFLSVSHCCGIFAARTTFPHFSISDLSLADNAPGAEGIGSIP